MIETERKKKNKAEGEWMIWLLFLAPLVIMLGMPYFARVSVLLSSVVILMIIPILAGLWLRSGSLVRIAYFPIIPLCLITESFAKALKEMGLEMAVRRCAMTVIVAAIIMLLAKVTGGLHLLLRYPEVLMVQIGCIVLVAEHLNLRLLEKQLTNLDRLSLRSGSGKTEAVTIEQA